MNLRVGSLFSGIGGFDLAARWMGWETAWYSEIDPFCCAVMAHHFPKAKSLGDITTVDWSQVELVDVICGGFPCQDISWAGSGAGIDGERSGLWSHYARAIDVLRPRYVVVENVAALLERGLQRVLGDLTRIGYDAEWSIVSACSVGAPHVRRRLFLVAYPDGQHGRAGVWDRTPRTIKEIQEIDGAPGSRTGWRARLENPSALYGGANGLSNGMDRNRALGNAIVPQAAWHIFQAIRAAEGAVSPSCSP